MDEQNQTKQAPKPEDDSPAVSVENTPQQQQPLDTLVRQDQSDSSQIAVSKDPVPLGPMSKSQKLKRIFFQVLIGCLVGAASIAVFAVLLGSFNDTLARALGTIVVVALHAALSFSYISESEKRDQKDGGRSIELFSNTVFALIAISFITAVFTIWQLLGGDIAYRLYLLYFVILFATLHADVLYRIRGFDSKIDTTVLVNYFLMAVVVVMLGFVIFVPSPSDLGEPFYRILAAVGIVDATLTLTAIIMHKLYMQKHPELAAEATSETTEQTKSFWRNPFVVILMIYLAFQVVGGLLMVAFQSFN